MAIQNTFINGNRYSWVSITVILGGIQYSGGPYKSINYNPKKDRPKVYGTGVRPLGRTRGQADFSGSVEMYRSEFDDWIANLMLTQDPSLGVLDLEFDIQVSYEEGDNLIQDNLIGCGITNLDLSNSQGADPSTVKIDLSMMDIELNGQSSVGQF